MFDFAQENEKLQIKSCIFEGRFFAPENIKIIKDLPPREQIIAELVGQIQSPLSGFVGVLNETIRGFLCLLDAIIQQKGVITETVSN
jgi:large subunit ribosomal protein L10